MQDQQIHQSTTEAYDKIQMEAKEELQQVYEEACSLVNDLMSGFHQHISEQLQVFLQEATQEVNDIEKLKQEKLKMESDMQHFKQTIQQALQLMNFQYEDESS